MNWIKLEKETPDKPEVVILARKLNISHGDAFLAIVRLLIWADGATADGFVPFLSRSDGDTFARLPGTCDALASPEIGWLSFSEAGMTFVNWGRHNGKSAKHRALETERKQRQRSGCPTSVPLQRGTKTGHEGGPEKRREEKSNNNPLPPSSSKATPPLIEEWTQYGKELGMTDAEATKAFDSYAACGWVIGKKRAPMKDWRATCRTAARNAKDWRQASLKPMTAQEKAAGERLN